MLLSLALVPAASASFLYWANDGATSTTVGRSNIDGTGVNQSFITGANIPCFVAVDATHVYWANVGDTTIGRAMRMSKALHFGCVWVNDHIPIVSEMPHGGFKQSGYGKDMSIYAIEAYTELKHVMIKH